MGITLAVVATQVKADHLTAPHDPYYAYDPIPHHSTYPRKLYYSTPAAHHTPPPPPPQYHEQPVYEESKKSSEFQYSVKDTYHGTEYSRHESSDATGTKGQYQVQLPDGRLQTVIYHADEDGFHAEVLYDREPHHPEPQPDYYTTPKPLYHSTPGPVYTSTTGPVYHSTPKSVYRTTSKPVYHSTPKAVHHTTSKTVYHTTSKPVYHSTPRPVYHSTPKPVYDVTPKPVHYSTQDPLYHTTPNSIFYSTSEAVYESTPEPPYHTTSAPAYHFEEADYRPLEGEHGEEAEYSPHDVVVYSDSPAPSRQGIRPDYKTTTVFKPSRRTNGFTRVLFQPSYELTQLSAEPDVFKPVFPPPQPSHRVAHTTQEVYEGSRTSKPVYDYEINRLSTQHNTPVSFILAEDHETDSVDAPHPQSLKVSHTHPSAGKSINIHSQPVHDDSASFITTEEHSVVSHHVPAQHPDLNPKPIITPHAHATPTDTHLSLRLNVDEPLFRSDTRPLTPAPRITFEDSSVQPLHHL
ncbi:Pro-resilin-like 46 [Homarus americanus]|uniref:Pro-resilin-like 46 n=1 Tax=Homarus americanus TaxID=6706 RepID=A0A8J5JCG3_HOMAM|nr:Pro-resilin-like 46 [Homarus americanus]